MIVAHRNLLFTVAYEMLGWAADAEDVLQETWLRWVDVDLATVQNRRAYLVRITARQALSRLRTLGRRKESYVGPWLPRTAAHRARRGRGRRAGRQRLDRDVAGAGDVDADRAAVFVLREVFDLEYDEIAAAVDKTPAAVHQIAHRARGHVAARRPRGAASVAETRVALAAFQRAVETGDLQGLVDILAPDVVFLGDGGGMAQAALSPVVGADEVAGSRLATAAATVPLQPAQVNGHPGLILRLDGRIDTVVAVRVEDGLITGLYAVHNAERLSIDAIIGTPRTRFVGGAAGFARVESETRLSLPMRAGAPRPVLGTGVSMVFLLPGLGEAFRLNGMAVDDRGGRIAVDMTEAYLHCARCVLRSKLWTAVPGTAPAPAAQPADGPLSAPGVAAFFAASPFAVISSRDDGDRADTSPRGDGAGLLQVLDGVTVALPDRRGNNRTDPLRNLMTWCAALPWTSCGAGNCCRI